MPRSCLTWWLNRCEAGWVAEKDLSNIKAGKLGADCRSWREDPEGAIRKGRPSLLQVSKAPTGRAGCRKCGENIDKGAIRVGSPIKWRGGHPGGWISAWTHLACTRLEEEHRSIPKEELKPLLTGLETIEDEEEVDRILGELCKEEGPQLATIDPNDEDFFYDVPARPGPLPTPPEMTQELLPFQKLGLGFMMGQEEGVYKGGILADEMGMGKTIQTISLLLAAKAKRLQEGSAEGFLAPTLVIAPTSAVMQWHDEIKDFTEEGSLKVMVYYGTHRKGLTKASIMAYDVVLTTYPVVETEYRKILGRHKVKCEYCDKLFLPRTLVNHNNYFCGPNAKRTRRQELTQKTKQSEETMAKGMKTLGIGVGKKKRYSSTPTPMQIFREYKEKAGGGDDEVYSMYTSKEEILQKRKEKKRKQAEAQEDEGEKEENDVAPAITQIDSPEDGSSPSTEARGTPKTLPKRSTRSTSPADDDEEEDCVVIDALSAAPNGKKAKKKQGKASAAVVGEGDLSEDGVTVVESLSSPRPSVDNTKKAKKSAKKEKKARATKVEVDDEEEDHDAVHAAKLQAEQDAKPGGGEQPAKKGSSSSSKYFKPDPSSIPNEDDEALARRLQDEEDEAFATQLQSQEDTEERAADALETPVLPSSMTEGSMTEGVLRALSMEELWVVAEKVGYKPRKANPDPALMAKGIMQRHNLNKKKGPASPAAAKAKKEAAAEEPDTPAASAGAKRKCDEDNVASPGKSAKKAKSKKKKDKNAPKKALSAFIFFGNEKRPALMAEGRSITECGSALGALWKELSEEEKKPYQEKATADKERYQTELAAYEPVVKDSPGVKEEVQTPADAPASKGIYEKHCKLTLAQLRDKTLDELREISKDIGYKITKPKKDKEEAPQEQIERVAKGVFNKLKKVNEFWRSFYAPTRSPATPGSEDEVSPQPPRQTQNPTPNSQPRTHAA